MESASLLFYLNDLIIRRLLKKDNEIQYILLMYSHASFLYYDWQKKNSPEGLSSLVLFFIVRKFGVGVHFLNVVHVFQLINEMLHGFCGISAESHGVVRNHGDF